MEEPSISELFNLGCKKPDCCLQLDQDEKISENKTQVHYKLLKLHHHK